MTGRERTTKKLTTSSISARATRVPARCTHPCAMLASHSTPRTTRDAEGRWRARLSRREELVEGEGGRLGVGWGGGGGEGARWCARSVTSSFLQPPVHSHRRQRWSGWSRWSPSRLSTPRPIRRSNPTAASSPERPPTAWTRPPSQFTTRSWCTR